MTTRPGASVGSGARLGHHFRVEDRHALAVDVELVLNPGEDSRAPGAEVTVALCGHWQHNGPCRWPHNSRIHTGADAARLRTVVVVPDDERSQIVRLIELALRADDRWSVLAFATGPITDAEQPLAARLAQL
jgi:hypothetical protein